MADVPSFEAMQSLAADVDAGKSIDEAIKAAPPIDEPDPATEKVAPEDKAPTVKPEAKGDPASSLKKTDAPKAEEKPKSKWAQNEERKSKTWEQINAEKEALRKEREEIQREREETKKQTVAAQKSIFKDDKGFTASDYDAAAKSYKERGDLDMADAAKQRAEEVRQAENKFRAESEQEEARQKWAATYNELAEKHPELKTVESPMYKGVLQILKDEPLLQRGEAGLKLAVKIYNSGQTVSEVEGLRGEKTKLQQELEKLQKKLSPSSGNPAEPLSSQKSKTDMTMDERRNEMEQLAAKIDQEAGYA